jgi:hypothetical protein
MLLTIALDVLIGYLLAKWLRKWWLWLPAALLAGVFISLAYWLTIGFYGALSPGEAAYQGLRNIPLNAAVCALYAGWLAKRRKSA